MSTALITTNDTSLQNYLTKINKFPFLSEEEEFKFAKDYYDNGNIDAAHVLVSSYLRYVVKIAKEYQGYGLSFKDLIQEGSVGLMRAVQKFDPYRGIRLATYAIHWIKRSIKEFIVSSWGLVKVATTSEKKQLFFRLRSEKEGIDPIEDNEAIQIAQRTNTDIKSVIEIDNYLLGRDTSLTPIRDDEEADIIIEDTRPSPEIVFMKEENISLTNNLVHEAIEKLSERERFIIQHRKLVEVPKTSTQIAEILNITRQRVNQIEKRAMEKLKDFLAPSIKKHLLI